MERSTNPTVLVIEDERELADMYERWLDEDYHVDVAYEGSAALEKLDESADVVILDRIMPEISGDEVLERIEESDLSCRVAIVSAVEPDFDVIGMGFDDYLTKPVSRSELADAVEKLLKRSEYTEKMQEYFSLVSKKAVLDTTKTERERQESERYAELLERIEALDEAVDHLRQELLDEDDLTVAFRDLAPRGE